jgi:hypothetical protein
MQFMANKMNSIFITNGPTTIMISQASDQTRVPQAADQTVVAQCQAQVLSQLQSQLPTGIQSRQWQMQQLCCLQQALLSKAKLCRHCPHLCRPTHPCPHLLPAPGRARCLQCGRPWRACHQCQASCNNAHRHWPALQASTQQHGRCAHQQGAT